jgi:nitrogen-specific signal transduction histidine kinase
VETLLHNPNRSGDPNRESSGVGVNLQTRTCEGEGIHAAQGREAATSRTHSVHFYEEDDEFLDSVSEYVGAALGAGGAFILIATRVHRQGIADRLTSWGMDLHIMSRNNRYIALDAEETLARFMVDGWPDEERFQSTIEPEMLRAKSGLMGRATSIVAFGEMVALLWKAGNCEAAIRLEKLWNTLSRRHSFSLRCAYPIDCFGEGSQHELFRQVCAEHRDVVPAESYTSLTNEGDRLRMIGDLQQQAHSLQAALDGREQEIAQREEVERKLRRSEEFAKKVVENSIDCLKVLDLEGRLEYMSLPGQKALEIEDINQFLGRRWVEFWKEEDWARAEAAVAVAKNGGVGSFRGECLTVGGVQKSWDVKITPQTGSNGQVESLIAVSRDITELKFAHQAIMQAEKLVAAGRLAATVAHEINNPLEAVTNFIYLAKTSEGVPEDVCRYLEIADRELTRVAQIAQQTLGFYKDNSRLRWVNVADVIGDVMVIYDRKARNKHLQVEVAVDAELTIFIKQGELKQSLSNLIANAIDASKDGGKLWLRAKPAKNWTNGMEPGLRITLADNGSGMTPEVQRRIFVPFFTTKPDVGTGIGLWVTKSLIEQQGGYLRFRSRQGENGGTVMSFFVPRAPSVPC